MSAEAMAVNGVFDGNDPVQVENLRARLEAELCSMAQQIALCGLVPTITLLPAFVEDEKGDMTPRMGTYQIEVDVRYGNQFYRDPKFYDFIAARMKADKQMEAANAPIV